MSKFRMNTKQKFILLHLLRNKKSTFCHILHHLKVFRLQTKGRAAALWKLLELLNYVFAIDLLSLIPSKISLLQSLRLWASIGPNGDEQQKEAEELINNKL